MNRPGTVPLTGLAMLGVAFALGAPNRAPSRPPRHVALIIGISDYENFVPGGPPGRSDLQGPKNDVELVRSTLRSRLFDQPDDIRVLTDSAASRAGIAAGFEWLIRRASDSNDVVVVFYSGHGSNAPDLNGDEARVTPGDHKDEALVPWDARDIHDPAQLVIDDQIGAWLDRLVTPNVTIIVDACFSGTATRGETDGTPRGPFDAIDDGESGTSESSGLRGNNRYTLITASSANETAQEKPLGPGGEVYGVLTFFLTQAIRGAGPTAHYDELFQRLVPQVKSKSNQSPQLEGDRSALLFSEKETLPNQAFVAVTALSGGRFRVDEGAVQGVRKSAVYELFPPAETKFTGSSLATLVVDSLEPLVAYGHVVKGNVRTAPKTRGVLARLPRGGTGIDRMPVYVQPDAQPLRPAVDGAAHVRLTSLKTAPVQLVRWGRGYMVMVHGLPILPQEEDSLHVVLAASGADSGGYAANAEALCSPLARAYAILSLEQLRNPEPPPGLRVQIRVLPISQLPDDQAVAVDTLFIGREVGVWVKVTAPPGSTLYLSLAVMGYSSSTSMLYPGNQTGIDGAGHIQPIELNQWLRIVDGIEPSAPAGPEVLKVLVDSDQYGLEQLVPSLACDGERGDSTAADEAVPINGWMTLEHRIMIVMPPTGG